MDRRRRPDGMEKPPFFLKISNPQKEIRCRLQPHCNRLPMAGAIFDARMLATFSGINSEMQYVKIWQFGEESGHP
jgi:hypothetical protein